MKLDYKRPNNAECLIDVEKYMKYIVDKCHVTCFLQALITTLIKLVVVLWLLHHYLIWKKHIHSILVIYNSNFWPVPPLRWCSLLWYSLMHNLHSPYFNIKLSFPYYLHILIFSKHSTIIAPIYNIYTQTRTHMVANLYLPLFIIKKYIPNGEVYELR